MRTLRLTVAFTLLLLFMGMASEAQTINYSLDYSDPASDVVQLNSTTMFPIFKEGKIVMGPDPAEVNILRLKSEHVGNVFKLHLEVKGEIVTLANTSYFVYLYTDAANLTHYIVNYTNGYLTIKSNSTAFEQNITGDATVGRSCVGGTASGRDNVLCITISESILGTIDAWNIDAAAVMYGDPSKGQYFSFVDYVWQMPGHPGTTPALIEGYVFVEGTSTPIEGASVLSDLGNYKTLSDATGAYALYLMPGTYNITVSKEGFQPSTERISVSEGQVVSKDFYLARSSIIDTIGLYTLLSIIIGAVVVIAVLLFVFLRRRRPTQSLACSNCAS